MDYETLSFDTDLFGKKTGRILPPILSETALSRVLSDMRAEEYRLAYWSSEGECPFDVSEFGGTLADKKTTFEIDLSQIDLDSLPSPKTVPYSDEMPMPQLERLALQSGEHSRFRVDANFSYKNFSDLYLTWIRKCVSRELADETLVILQANQIAGMVTVAQAQGVGSIGLIAVDEQFRGQQFGQGLVYDALRWSIQHGCRTAQVVTQGDNLAACNLYEKCGYHRKAAAYVYHFWL